MLVIIFHRTIFSFQQSSNSSVFFFNKKILLEVFYEYFLLCQLFLVDYFYQGYLA